MGFQRSGGTKFKSLDQIDPERIKIHVFCRFLADAQEALEQKGEVDSALRFEILREYLARDFDPRKGALKYTSIAIGL